MENFNEVVQGFLSFLDGPLQKLGYMSPKGDFIKVGNTFCSYREYEGSKKKIVVEMTMEGNKKGGTRLIADVRDEGGEGNIYFWEEVEAEQEGLLEQVRALTKTLISKTEETVCSTA